MPDVIKGLGLMSPEEKAKSPYDFCPDCEKALFPPGTRKEQKPPDKQPKVTELREPKPGVAKGAPGQKPPEPPQKENGEEKKREEKKRKEKPEKKPEKPALPFDIDKKDVKKAMEGAEDVKEEFKKATTQKVDKTTPDFQPVGATTSASMYKDLKFISEMNSALSDWRTGYVDKIGQKGARLDVREYIRSKGKEPFITRLKRSAKGRKILVIADFSGSMHGRQEEYKRALINGLEVLNSIGSKIAFFGFGTEQNRHIFFKIKKFEEPQWTLTHSSKLASLVANYPSTPLPTAYRKLHRYIKMHRPNITLTVTDGSPTNGTDAVTKTKEWTAKLRNQTRMVAFGLGENAEAARKMETQLKELGYNKVFAVSSMRVLPEKMVRLLAPER